MDQLLSTQEAADYIGIKPGTLRKWRWHGTGPSYVRLGRSKRARVVYRASDLTSWLSERVHTDTSKELVNT